MKKSAYFLFLFLLLISCQTDEKVEQIKFYRNSLPYTIDSTVSYITIKAFSVDSNYSLSTQANGFFLADESGLSGGVFYANLKKLNRDSVPELVFQSLISDSVLAVAKYSQFKIELEGVSPYFPPTNMELKNKWINEQHLSSIDSASCQLNSFITLRDSTRNFVFPLIVHIIEKELVFKASFYLPINQWGAVSREHILKSDTIFHFYSKILIELDLVAKRK